MNKLPKGLQKYCDYYNGDKSWRKLVACFPHVDYNDEKLRYIPEDIYSVASWHVGNVEAYFNNCEIPVFEYYSPKDLLLNYIDGEIVIRAILMRFPC